MRTFLGIVLSLPAFIFATPSLAQSPLHFWSRHFGNDSGLSHSVAVDASGNVLVTGSFQGALDFGGGSLFSAGDDDIFVAKFNASGVLLWSKRFGSTNADAGTAVAVDASGNVLVTGSFQGTVSFGGANLVSVGLDDIFVAKFNASGVHQWSQRFGSTNPDVGAGIVADGSGNVVVTGSFQGTVSFGGANQVSAGSSDIFLAKYNAGGVHQWSQRFGSTNSELGDAVAVDASGNVVVTGTGLLAKLDPGGTLLWSKSVPLGGAISVDTSGNVVVAGSFQITINLGGGNLVPAGGADVFVAKFNPSGVHQWSQRFGGTNDDHGNGVAVDASGNVVVTGDFIGTASFGGGNLTSIGSPDIFLAIYNASGAYQWSRRVGGTLGQSADALAADGSGNLLVTGYFGGTVNFGGGDLVSTGVDDIFVVKYLRSVATPLITSIVDAGNDQGRKVRIRFSRAGYDDIGTSTPISHYEAYRRNDAIPSVTAESLTGASSKEQLLDAGWVYAGNVYAHGASSYMMDAPTDADSTITLGQHYSVFFVRAALTPGVFYDSPIDSGYSVDNLAPGVPTSFAYSAGALHWNGSSAADFDYFAVYGSSTNSFGAATLVDYSVLPTMDVTASPYAYYFVTATDFSGNEGKPAKVHVSSGVRGTPTSYALSISAYPNPFNPETTMRYTLPSKGRVTLEVFDARGSHVVTLVNEEKDAGAHTVTWNGHDDHGATAGSGVYFARLTSPAGTRSYKMTLLK